MPGDQPGAVSVWRPVPGAGFVHARYCHWQWGTECKVNYWHLAVKMMCKGLPGLFKTHLLPNCLVSADGPVCFTGGSSDHALTALGCDEASP
jgi:hypothetical protein